VTGSGKSTLAARLADATTIEWHSVDDLTWEPGWVEVPFEEPRRRIEHICERPEWILDTAYAKWLDVALERAQLIVALDYPRWFSLQRLVRRTVTPMPG
jgi:adenylate kinase family enzyme